MKAAPEGFVDKSWKETSETSLPGVPFPCPSLQHAQCFVNPLIAAVTSLVLFWFGLEKCQVPTKTALSLPLLRWTEEKKYDERLEGQDKDRERSLTNHSHRQNRLNLGRKGSVIHHQSNSPKDLGCTEHYYNHIRVRELHLFQLVPIQPQGCVPERTMFSLSRWQSKWFCSRVKYAERLTGVQEGGWGLWSKVGIYEMGNIGTPCTYLE